MRQNAYGQCWINRPWLADTSGKKGIPIQIRAIHWPADLSTLNMIQGGNRHETPPKHINHNHGCWALGGKRIRHPISRWFPGLIGESFGGFSQLWDWWFQHVSTIYPKRIPNRILSQPFLYPKKNHPFWRPRFYDAKHSKEFAELRMTELKLIVSQRCFRS